MTVIDELLEQTPPPERAELERIRQFVHELCPEATEVKTYGMPGFKYKNKYLLSFAAFKDHMSLFPGAGPTDILKSKLDGYTLSKGTIQFTLDHSLSDELLRDIIHLCIDRIDAPGSRTGY